MAWYRGTGKENHRSVFENVSHDRCIFCGDDRTKIARTDFTIMFHPRNITQVQSARPVITLTQSKLKRSSAI